VAKITNFPFAHFAAVSWFDHYVDSIQGRAAVEPLVLKLLMEKSTALVTWIKLHDMDPPFEERIGYALPITDIAQPLYYVALLGLESMIHSFLPADINDTWKASDAVNTLGGFLGNALQAASYNGHEKVVQILLDQGANANAQGGHFGNALQAASANGDENVIQLLLDHGVYINSQGGYYGNALQAASLHGLKNWSR
jgi:hypothetical protein